MSECKFNYCRGDKCQGSDGCLYILVIIVILALSAVSDTLDKVLDKVEKLEKKIELNDQSRNNR